MSEGMAKTTRADVDVARRGFWRKCLGAAVSVAAVATLSLATAGVGTVGLVGLGLLGGLAVKGSADAALSFMNWRNRKAELLGEPPRFAFLNQLPESVRQDATAAGLMGLGMSEKKARLVSGALGMTLGIAAVALLGFNAAGIGGAALALAPVAVEKGLHAWGHKMEERRERHVEATHVQMEKVSASTQTALDALQSLEERLLSEDADAAPDDMALADPQLAPLRKLKEEARALQADAREQMEWFKTDLMDRVERKALAKTSGLGAVLLDSVTEGGSHMFEVFAHTPLHAVSTTALLLRSGLEHARTVRSERRDNDKMQTFEQLHQDLQQRISELTDQLQTQMSDLNLLRQDVEAESADAVSNRSTAYFGSERGPNFA